MKEEGTEAAAATAVVVTRKAMSLPLELNADRPFLFFPRDAHTGAVLFMGRVVDPTKRSDRGVPARLTSGLGPRATAPAAGS